MIQPATPLSEPSAHGPVRYAVGEHATRPWGAWEVLATGVGYIIKRIVVDPGHRLSLQYHRHRSEHWTILEGSAEAEIDGRRHALAPGAYVHVPLGALHRIGNAGPVPVVVLEIQIGDYLDEQDIVRVQDDYARP